MLSMDEPFQQPIRPDDLSSQPSPDYWPAPPGIPPDVATSSPTPVLLEPPQPALWLPVTVLCAVFFAFAMIAQYVLVLTTERDEWLDAPEAFLEHVTGRNLDLEELADERPTWEILLDKLQGYDPGDLLNDAIEAHDEFCFKTAWFRPNRTLAILLAEAGRLDESNDELTFLEDEPSDADFVAAVRFAYWDADSDSNPPRIDCVWSQVHPRWARDKLMLRIAEKRGDQAASDAARARLDARSRKLRDQAAPLMWGPALVIAASVLVLIGWVGFGRPRLTLGDGQTVSPWSVGRGASVMVRAALAGLVLQTLVANYVLEDFQALHGFMSLIGILPLLALSSYFLLRPWGLTLSACFGLAVPFRRWGALLLFTVALAGIDMIGTIAITALTELLGIRMHWAESPDESFLWDPAWVVGLNFFDGVVWAPVFEEIGCRGFLYTTVRRWLPAVPAALATGILFSVPHLYSLQGFLAVAWSGFIWSLAYEKSRSLLPGMFSHSFGNVLAFGGMLLIYRV
jgi:membrane protease YdiL (CAAX protease family)